MTWADETQWERSWWGTCVNSYMEEEKQLIYARKMGLNMYHDGKTPYNFSVKGRILDIGGGPISILLKCPYAKGTVIDPCDYPAWIAERYKCAGMDYIHGKGEDLPILSSIQPGFDEVWIYNVLQHVENPKTICDNALEYGRIVRIFEWVDNGVSPGHPQNLHEAELNQWLKGIGKVEVLNTSICKGKCYCGIFVGKK